MEACVKAVNQSKTMIEAQSHCELEGATLARPQLDINVGSKSLSYVYSKKVLVNLSFLHFCIQVYLMGKMIHDAASSLNHYLLGFHMADDSIAYPGIFSAPEGL